MCYSKGSAYSYQLHTVNMHWNMVWSYCTIIEGKLFLVARTRNVYSSLRGTWHLAFIQCIITSWWKNDHKHPRKPPQYTYSPCRLNRYNPPFVNHVQSPYTWRNWYSLRLGGCCQRHLIGNVSTRAWAPNLELPQELFALPHRLKTSLNAVTLIYLPAITKATIPFFFYLYLFDVTTIISDQQ